MDQILTELRLEISKLEESIDKLQASNPVSSASTIQLNAGGFGVWLATTACIVMLAVNVFTMFIMFGQQRRIERLEDYLSSIYTQAPQLKPSSYDNHK